MSIVLRAKRELERRCGPVRFDRDPGDPGRVGVVMRDDDCEIIGTGPDHVSAILAAHQTLSAWIEAGE